MFYLMCLLLFFNTKWIDKFSKNSLEIPKEFYTEKVDDLTLIMLRICVTFVKKSVSSSSFFETSYTILQPSALFSQEFLRKDSQYHLLFSIEFFWELLKNSATNSFSFTKTILISANFHNIIILGFLKNSAVIYFFP